MDVSDAEPTFTSFASSISTGLGRRDTVEKRRDKPVRPALVEAVDVYITTPTVATASQLFKLARRLTAHSEFFAVNHTSLCLKLLDTLAEHLLTTVASNKSLDAEVEESQYSPPTQQSPEESLQLLELCYLFTRKTAIGYPSHSLCKLLQWLVETVAVGALRHGCEADTELKLQLVVLAEMVKISAGVRIYVKEIKKIKDFYRSLTILLNNTEDAELLVFSMAILARLVLSESMGSKLFSDKNVEQAFALVFSVLDGSWHDNADENMSASNTILERRSLLQVCAEDIGALSNSEEYLHSVDVCRLLAKLGELSAIRAICVQSISLNQANVEASTKTIDKLHVDMQQMLRFQDEIKAQQDQELKEIGVKFADQIRQKDDGIQKMRDAYEGKLREVTMQCESMGQHMNKKISALQQREALLQESRAKRGILEDENSELKRKVQVLEIRLEEVAQTHSIAMEEMKLRDKELAELREEMASISGDYTTQREELEAAHDETKRLEDELNEQKLSNENVYKELVLLSKAHKALSDEKKTVEHEMGTLRDDMGNLESLNISIQSRLQEKKELADQLERKMARLDDAATVSRNALEDERDKRRAVSQDLDDFRKAHRKLENDMAMLEIQTAEQRLVVESKDEYLRKCEEEIRHLTKEVGKQVKLQALIHQLSSSGDTNVNINEATSFLSRDS
ncbi:hypothetical protein BBO99_00000076 [Phytophthora kernoviae]|uniref:CIP2A N-terminal domain-containing protein n=2 Tax=Phytophthora kernoviae TaxID=325452 RepID=A0A3R7H6T5_9STRA|nr:hypothetical protein G195_002096 [Phytophthora kernoviae 00238/432]KAG2533108.1 hypothetical protein JM16_000158 [Phytophthora kernoviae]KAG2533366.1 hypothetical protein JM18_000195 [Phytophthora kernoviae]RLN26870.1 hypothetical protein BBI17_000076 [Phytophthora kernoviae]RLN86001.1 hypothetical protein BBO99_00000076 [Phytophthora kernoviae]